MTKYKLFQKNRIHPINIKLINEDENHKKREVPFLNSPIAFFRNKYENSLNRKHNKKNRK